MKIFLSIIIFSITVNTFSQDGWFWLNPMPQGNWLSDVEFTSNNTIYVSGYGGTMMKSTDSGNSFSILTNKECGKQILFINNLTGFSNSTNGILKTTNGGNNWRYIPAPVDSVLNYDSSPAILLYGIKNNKVFLSSNMGESWSLSLSAFLGDIIYSAYFLNNNTGYAAGSKPIASNKIRIYKTSNSGVSWDTIPVSLTNPIKNILFLNSNVGFALTNTQRFFIKTTNGGYNWVTVFDLTNGNPFNEIIFFDSNNGYLKGPHEVKYTTNQGINWSSSGLIQNYTFLKNLNEGLGIGIYDYQNFLSKTTNMGINWTTITTGFVDDFYDVTFINETTGFTGGYNNIYKTTNSGINWTIYNLGLSYYNGVNNIMFLNNNTGYAGIDGGQIAKTTNCGLNWVITQTVTNDHLYGMSFPSIDTGYAVTKWGSTVKSTNAGIDWIYLNSESERAYEDVIFSNNLTGYIGGYAHDSDKAIIKKTQNGGNSWINIFLDSMTTINDLCLSPDNSLFAAGFFLNNSAYNGVIYRTTNTGKTWLFSRFPYRISSIHFPSELTGYASSDNNIMYKTTNGGENWYATYCVNYFNSYGLYFLNDNTGYAVSPYGQIIKTTTGGGVLISVEPISYTVPHKFNLYQNYPNPFNPTTNIKFDIPKAMNTSLKVYDILGREISVIVNDFLIPGTYAFDFDGSNYSSGLYFYVLRNDEFSESKKMILLK